MLINNIIKHFVKGIKLTIKFNFYPPFLFQKDSYSVLIVKLSLYLNIYETHKYNS